MKLILALLLVCALAVQAFVPTTTLSPVARLGVASSRLATSSSSTAVSSRSSSSALRMSGEQGQFWEGEWICADCGYIYDADDCGGLAFEQQKKGFVCPQCRGPRRRFAKKVGDKVGVTQDGGDGAILLFSFLGMAATIAFGFWFAGQ